MRIRPGPKNHAAMGLLCLAALLSPARAEADPVAEMIKKGVRLYAVADFERSLAVFKGAREKTTDPRRLGRIYFYMACNQLELEQPTRAYEAFKQAFTHDPSLAIRGSFKPEIVEMFDQVRGTVVGHLSVRSTPPGAEVRLDSRVMGKTPVTRLALRARAYQVELVLEGYKRWRREKAVVAGKERTMAATLQPTQATAGSPDVDTDEAPRSRTRTVLAWAGLGLAVAATATAGVLYGVGVSNGDEAHEAYVAATRPGDALRYREEVEGAQTKVLAGHVLAGVATAALGLSIYCFVTRREAPTSTSGAGVVVGFSPSPGGAGFSVAGSF